MKKNQNIEKYLDKSLLKFSKKFKTVAMKNNYPYVGLILLQAILKLETAVNEKYVFVLYDEERQFANID